MQIIKSKREIIKSKREKDYEPLHFALADWFYSKGPKEIIAHGVIANWLNKQKNQIDPSEEHDTSYTEMYSLISRARMVLEESERGSILNVAMVGYRFIEPKSVEIAEFAIKSVKKTILHADRANRLAPLVDQRHIPGAIEKIFEGAKNRIEQLSGIKKQFLLTWQEITKDKNKKEKSNGKHE